MFQPVVGSWNYDYDEDEPSLHIYYDGKRGIDDISVMDWNIGWTLCKARVTKYVAFTYIYPAKITIDTNGKPKEMGYPEYFDDYFTKEDAQKVLNHIWADMYC